MSLSTYLSNLSNKLETQSTVPPSRPSCAHISAYILQSAPGQSGARTPVETPAAGLTFNLVRAGVRGGEEEERGVECSLPTKLLKS